MSPHKFTRALIRNRLSGFFAFTLIIAATPSISGQTLGTPGPEVSTQMQKVLDAYRALNATPVYTQTPEQARKGITAKDAVNKLLTDEGKSTMPEGVSKVQNLTVPGPAGNVPVRVYTPVGEPPFPIVVYYHGGGFVLADKDVYDASARAIANQAKAVVVSVDYRRAPENPYPAALDDATAAFKYVQDNAKKYGGDGRVAVAGESAGGNLATAVCMRQKSTRGRMPRFQLLIYPFISNHLTTPSHLQFGRGEYLISNKNLAWFWKQYLGDNWRNVRDPLALPIQATTEQLKGLPPTLIILASLDPLQSEGEQYAYKLQQAGVPVTTKKYHGVTHEFFGMGSIVDQARRAQEDAGVALKAAFEKREPPRRRHPVPRPAR